MNETTKQNSEGKSPVCRNISSSSNSILSSLTATSAPTPEVSLQGQRYQHPRQTRFRFRRPSQHLLPPNALARDHRLPSRPATWSVTQRTQAGLCRPQRVPHRPPHETFVVEMPVIRSSARKTYLATVSVALDFFPSWVAFRRFTCAAGLRREAA